MNTIVIGNYNNYYNRIHKPALENAFLYSQAGFANIHVFPNINFNRNDGVDAEHTINFVPADTNFNDNINPDYFLVCEADTYNTVVSRWFVTECRWNRDHQLVLTLRRDILADFWDAFKNNDFYCEKGSIPTGYNILSYNSEGMTFNSILKKRVALRPSIGQTGRYIVGYIDRKFGGGRVYNTVYNYEYDSMEEFPLAKYVSGTRHLVQEDTIKKGYTFGMCQANDPGSIGYASGPYARMRYYISEEKGEVVVNQTAGVATIGSPTFDRTTAQALAKSISKYFVDNRIAVGIKSDLEDHFDFVSDEYSLYHDSNIRIGDKVYNVELTASDFDYNGSGVGGFSESLFTAIKQTYSDMWASSVAYTDIKYWLRYTEYVVTLTEIGSYVTIPASRNHAGNNPYDIFVMNDNETTRGFASRFATQYSAQHVVYDVQVLPFEPTYDNSGSVDVGGGNLLHWATSDSKSGHFYHESIKTYSGNVDIKKGSNLDMCRIYSPDGASCWEFNPAKIGGVAQNSIRYEVTFAPLRPYMHIFPHFAGIYGSVNKASGETATAESRGLICTGDYTIPYSTNNWAEFQYNNSAYQLAHDRQIENMSIMHNAERLQENVNIISGTLSGAMGGAQSGFMAGGAYGAVAGGIVGGVGTLAGGLASKNINEQLRSEEISYVEDMFGYQLQNIKAQAQPLAHSNYITIGVAFFPYIEYYSCDDVESTIFEERLRVNGWTLGIVTNMSAMKEACSDVNSPSAFCKGRLVRFSGEEDSHVVNEINAELQRGVRFR